MNDLQHIILQRDAWISGRLLKKGEEIDSTPEVVEAGYRAAKRETVRRTIRETVGDTDSILGTTADGLHWLLVEFLGFAKLISEAKDLNEVKAGARAIVEKSTPIVGDNASKRLKMPYSHKKGTDVLKEVAAVANKTTAALEGNAAEVQPEVISPVDQTEQTPPAKPYVSPFKEMPPPKPIFLT